MLAAIQKRLFRPSPPLQGPLGLSPDQVEAVCALRSQPGWPHYLKALEVMAEYQVRPLVTGLLPPEKYYYQVGVLDAFRRIIMLPDQLATLQQRSLKHDRTERGADAAPDFLQHTVWYDRARGIAGNGTSA